MDQDSREVLINRDIDMSSIIVLSSDEEDNISNTKVCEEECFQNMKEKNSLGVFDLGRNDNNSLEKMIFDSELL